MKKTLIPILSISCLLLASWSLAAASNKGVRRAFINYVVGADKRDIQKIDKVLHGNFRSGFTWKGKSQVFVGSRDGYLKLLSEGKIGGVPRRIKIQSLKVTDNTATVSARLESKAMAFKGTYVFINDGSGWKLLQEIVVVRKK